MLEGASQAGEVLGEGERDQKQDWRVLEKMESIEKRYNFFIELNKMTWSLQDFFFEEAELFQNKKKWEGSQAVSFYCRVIHIGCNLQAWVQAHHLLLHVKIKCELLLQHLQKYCPAFLLPIYLLIDLWKYSKIKIL